MSKAKLIKDLIENLDNVRHSGLYKSERVISSAQQAAITVVNEGKEVINFCANNYLGLANHPDIVAAAQQALKEYGYGMASVRFICGTQLPHKQLEQRLSQFLSTEDTILYPSCFAANTGLFETLLDVRDAIISDKLNHASIIDGVRLCKAQRFRYANNDMASLEEQLQKAQECRYRLICTDGVFSMDGFIANVPKICELAQQYDALVMIDDAHSVGVLGPKGNGTAAHFGLTSQVDIITGTLGKALGGAIGGYTSGRKEVIEWLRQRSRPYLFSNSLPPMVAAGSLQALDLLESSTQLRDQLKQNQTYFRSHMHDLGFDLLPGEHPIVPVMLGDAKLATEMADLLLKEGIYVIGFSYPVVPQGEARIRVQLSSAHTQDHLDQAIAAFAKVGRQLDVI